MQNRTKCDYKVPACTRCVENGVQCVGFDSATQQEAPRSIADFLEAHISRLEGLRSQAALQAQNQARATVLSPADLYDLEAKTGPYRVEKCAFADSLVNQVMEDITPSFLGVTKARPLLQCVVRGTRLPSKKGPVGANDLDENHPRSILNPQTTQGLFHSLMPDEVGANTLMQNYLDRVITQYPIYHRNDVTTAFNSIFHKTATTPAEDSIRNRYIVCIIMAISLTTSARNQVQKANDTAYRLVRHAMQWIPEVATNDIPGLQAILILTQYIFLNPKMADLWLLTGLISQAIIDLGLHQELPNEVSVTPFQRDMRRRLFWCAWEMEIGVCCIFLRPTSLPIRRIEVAFPLEVDDTAITQVSVDLSGRVSKFTQRIICRFRLIEAEIVSVLWHGEDLPPECSSLEQWMQKCITAMEEWQGEIYASSNANRDRGLVARWHEMLLYSEIALPYVRVSLNRSSRRVPNPTTQQMMDALVNAVKVADGYLRQAEGEAGKIKYVFHPCHHVFNCALVFLQGLQRCKQEVAASYSWQQVEEWMHVFTRCFSSIAERWAAAKRCLEEYERLLAPIKREYEDFLAQKASLLPLSLRPEVSMTGLYEYARPVTAPTEVDEAYNHWNVFNLTRGGTVETTELLTAPALNNIPLRDWNAEFALD
ncbi:GAL4-like transcription factor-like protein [Plenodomus tracheiphilus IPT5]|uniref:GAL4-like transcription factor-like protein n=1 Tax=Plenodomus tracheiphilus IPT5 TaxID=1408161 RepID=A0A6A7BDZ9_9PLEO|nr:GAL4-like transcription factor-like protein [Plenodomus tracheiphilus IPT5]